MTVVDVMFPLTAAEVPLDHGYALYGALSRVVPELHGASWLGIHPLGGRPIGEGRLTTNGRAGLRLRLPVERIPAVLPLTGKTLDIAGAKLKAGAPSVHSLVSAASLDARLVVVKLTNVPRHDHPELHRPSLDRSAVAARVFDDLERQLTKIGAHGSISLRGHGRMTVAGRTVVGFSVRVSELDADSSLALLTHGLGGKRRMGCGIFRPTRLKQRPTTE